MKVDWLKCYLSSITDFSPEAVLDALLDGFERFIGFKLVEVSEHTHDLREAMHLHAHL